jgi:hypothetical protein
MREGIEHWEELVELEEKNGYKCSVTHLESECIHYKELVAAYLVCMYACIWMFGCLYVCICMYLYVCECIHFKELVAAYLVCMYVCMYVCMCVAHVF